MSVSDEQVEAALLAFVGETENHGLGPYTSKAMRAALEAVAAPSLRVSQEQVEAAHWAMDGQLMVFDDVYERWENVEDEEAAVRRMLEAAAAVRNKYGDDPRVRTARHLMCTPGGRALLQEQVLQPFGYIMASLPPDDPAQTPDQETQA